MSPSRESRSWAIATGIGGGILVTIGFWLKGPHRRPFFPDGVLFVVSWTVGLFVVGFILRWMFWRGKGGRNR